ncbi:FMN-binding domain-containing protein [Clostridium aceticum]|uniref:FMN-binding domain-containing protein n=1 Tax=Clostridium aceticum TaxID=84022 RepID=A0A0G3W6F2_9CLOT|nr:FMN-binding protein [Clostridium aceticum]AKL94271.1 FMN-binding domain-containing protein [Clostridium aceticum]
MKNKMLALFLVMIMVLVGAVACAPEEAPPAPTETPEETPAPEETPEETPEAREIEYEDDTYRGELEVNEKGWTSVVEIVVEDGKITEVDYDEVDEDGNRKSEDEEYNERWEAAAGTNALEAYPQLEQSLIETQDIEAIDTVSGATATVRDFKDVVRQALGQENQQ